MTLVNTVETRIFILQAAYTAFGKFGFDGTAIKNIATPILIIVQINPIMARIPLPEEEFPVSSFCY